MNHSAMDSVDIIMTAKRICVTFLLLSVVSLAADFKRAKIIDLQDMSIVGGGVLDTPSANGVPVSATARVPSSEPKFEMTVELDGKLYTAVFPQDRHFQMADLQRGAFINARVEGKKLGVQRPFDGKEMKAKITREEKAQPPEQN
jgi:hypothetical protein